MSLQGPRGSRGRPTMTGSHNDNDNDMVSGGQGVRLQGP